MQIVKPTLLSPPILRPDRLSWPILAAATLATAISLWIGLRAMSVAWTQQQVVVFPELEGLSIVRLLLMAAYAIFGVSYCRWILRPTPQQDRFVQLLKITAPVGVLALLAFPSSTDVFLYLHYGTMAWQGINPYLVPVEQVASPYSLFLHWPGVSPYAPLSQVLFMAAAWTVNWGVLPSLLLFKSLCLGIHGLNGYLIWRSLSPSPRQTKLTLAYLLNPVLLSEFVVNAHNEVLLTTLVIVAIVALYRGGYSLALLAMIGGGLVKTLPIVWIPLVWLYLARRGQWRPIGVSLGVILAVAGVLSQTILANGAWLNLLDPAVHGLTHRSLHHVVRLVADTWPPIAAMLAMGGVQGLTILAAIVIGLGSCARILRRCDYDAIGLVQDITWLTLALLLAKPYLAPWHLTTVMLLAGLTIQSPRLWLLGGLIGLSPLLFYGTGGGENAIGLISSLLFLAIVLLGLGLPAKYGRAWGQYLQP
jgi:alpha-1,6-mannosyltransferase